MASNTPSTTVNAKVYGSAREQCWAARDAYHECLRNEGGDRKACENLYKVFTESCPASWVCTLFPHLYSCILHIYDVLNPSNLCAYEF